MKKVLATILALLLVVSFTCPVSALSMSDENTINGIELSIKKQHQKFSGKAILNLQSVF